MMYGMHFINEKSVWRINGEKNLVTIMYNIHHAVNRQGNATISNMDFCYRKSLANCFPSPQLETIESFLYIPVCNIYIPTKERTSCRNLF